MRKSMNMMFCLNLLGMAGRVVAEEDKTVDVLLIGGGIMSSTLGTYLQELEPGWSITMVERMGAVAEESSGGWNNAGTGHSAFMELNYTPEKADGSIDISKAVEVNEAFDISRQFWAYQVKNNVLRQPASFINSVPHMNFVWGEENSRFLRKRYDALQHSSLFRAMEYTEDPARIKQWAPLLIEGRDPRQSMAATRILGGTDVNYGEITRQLVSGLQQRENFTLRMNHEVRDIARNADNSWRVTVADMQNGERKSVINARFVFIGAGGAALPLLQKSGIPEAKGYGGFPVGGGFLVSTNPAIVQQHMAKVYGKAAVGSPPMSVPHLDTRILDGEPALLFGPFATFSSKFLKNGSLWDLFSSVNAANILPMAHVGINNLNLIKYLINQVMMKDDDRFAALREYYPQATPGDWKLVIAGQRVQIIKKDAQRGGVLKMGTEVVCSQDGTIAALLGASPGASTSAPVMLELLERVFKEKAASPGWRNKLKEIIPSYGQRLNGNVALTEQIRRYTDELLQLHVPETH
ncbi:malate dehydrogenase (quinone) [Affinibrenneria salicis]|uniref:Probable malate:quinone oxidoreductase n=1 Tax=Affinibrenneria salicis TaxID=2590031 RepID=A0A5J5FTN1_9GAMM|nr:malate dehydrogenase (quinone) [Affinibrenneria salicis]KAA8996945.1 malate dehydrogenase (quinone) [Affinibrenneria salicis]